MSVAGSTLRMSSMSDLAEGDHLGGSHRHRHRAVPGPDRVVRPEEHARDRRDLGPDEQPGPPPMASVREQQDEYHARGSMNQPGLAPLLTSSVKKSVHFNSYLEPPGMPCSPGSCSTARANSNPTGPVRSVGNLAMHSVSAGARFRHTPKRCPVDLQVSLDTGW
jgi:hypothetical protein